MKFLLDDGKFYPFAISLEESDFSVKDLAKRLGLDKVRRELLTYILKDLEIQIWFNEKNDKPYLELNVFWIDGYFVSGVDLMDVMEDALNDEDVQLETDKELEVLTRLRDRIDKAINKRKDVEDRDDPQPD